MQRLLHIIEYTRSGLLRVADPQLILLHRNKQLTNAHVDEIFPLWITVLPKYY